MHWSLFKYSVSDSILVACVSQVCCELPKVCSELPSIQNPVSVLDSKLENSISLQVKTELDPIQKVLLDISSKLDSLGNPSIQLSQTACPVVLMSPSELESLSVTSSSATSAPLLTNLCPVSPRTYHLSLLL